MPTACDLTYMIDSCLLHPAAGKHVISLSGVLLTETASLRVAT